MNFVPTDPIFFKKIRNVLLIKQRIFQVELTDYRFLCCLSLPYVPAYYVWVLNILHLFLLLFFILLNKGFDGGLFQNMLIFYEILVLQFGTYNTEHFFLGQFQVIVTVVFKQGVSKVLSGLVLGSCVKFLIVKMSDIFFLTDLFLLSSVQQFDMLRILNNLFHEAIDIRDFLPVILLSLFMVTLAATLLT